MLIRAILLIAFALFAAAPASAQMMIGTSGGGDETATIDDPTSPEQVREMVSRLSDAEVRAILLSRLDAVAEAAQAEEQASEGGLIDFAHRATIGVYESVIDAAGRAAFDNCQEYLDLYGAERIIPEMDRPRISSRRLVPHAIKDRLAGCANVVCNVA